jgi:hypothetical protein
MYCKDEILRLQHDYNIKEAKQYDKLNLYIKSVVVFTINDWKRYV